MARNASQAGKYSVQKGKRHERKVAKEFREWTGDQNFRRTPGSGGFNKAHQTKVGEKEFASDIMAERKLLFSIEAKSEEGFSLDALLNPQTVGTTKFTKWWFQVCTDSERVGLMPFLMFKPIPAWDWIALSTDGMNRLKIPSDFPSIGCIIYNEPVSGEINDMKGGKIPHTATLPNPIIYRWKDIKSNIDGKLIFED